MRNRSVATLGAIGVVSALVLGACGSSSNKGGSGGLTNSPTGGQSSNATYTIAFEGPLSGNYAQLGINEVNAVDLAIEQANAKGDLGFTLKLIKADDQGDPAKAPAAASQVLLDNTVMGVIGPSFSGTTLAVAGKKYGAAGVTIVDPSASNATIQDQGFPTWHRIFPNDNAEGAAAAQWLATKAKSVMVINDRSPYGDGVAQQVAKVLKDAGVKVDEQGVPGAGQTKDYGPSAQTVANSGDDAMFYAGYDADAAKFAKALDAAGYKGLKMGGNGVKSSTFETGAGNAGNGWYFSCGCQDPTTAPSSQAFSAAYSAKFNTPPSTYSPEAYDATNILIAAIKTAMAAGTVTRAAVNDAVNKTDYDGITTHITFGANGDLPEGEGTVNLFRMDNGKIHSLGDITKQ